MQTPKARSGTSEVPQRVSPRPVRRLRPSPLETDSASSSSTTTQPTRTPKQRSPQVIERKSPRSPVPEKRRPSRLSELESQIAQLQEDLKQSREELRRSDSESKKTVSALSSKLEESQLRLRELSSSEEGHLSELQRISQERDQAWKCELESVQKQHSVDSTALASAIDEVQWLKIQLEMVAASEAEQTNRAESANEEIRILRGDLAETISVVEDMKTQLRGCKESEAEARELVRETLLQLESAKTAVESLRLEGAKAAESHGSIASELEKSRARVSFLEGLVSELNAGRSCGDSGPEMGRLKLALEASEARYHEEQIKSTVEITTARELAEQIKSELEAELKRARAEIEELRANLMDKETELQCITEENEGLRDSRLAEKLRSSTETAAELKASLMDKETEVQSMAEENEALKSEIGRIEAAGRELEAARCRESAAVEDGERAAAELNSARVQMAAMEAEMRKVKVQSEQWRKAAEAAASMLSAGNNDNNNGSVEGKYMERTGSLDSSYYSPGAGKFGSLFSDVADEELLKKKNGNVLKKIGVLWKKPQK